MAMFDLDGTLAPTNQPVSEATVSALRQMEDSGVRIALCSGKPTYYLCGLARQLGLRDIALIGETGFSVQFGVELPPRLYHEMPIPPTAKDFLASLESEIKSHVDGRIWFQPNSGSLTVFYYDDQTRDVLDVFLTRKVGARSDLRLFRQFDCFDVTFGLTKATGIQWLLDACEFGVEDVVYVGDSENDQPAFDLLPDSVAIDPGRTLRAPVYVDTLEEALHSLVVRLPVKGDEDGIC